jgi:hypothetical protein
LPASIGALRVKKADVACTALVYEFEKPSESDAGKLNLPSLITARQHLEKSGLLAAIATAN